MLFVGLISNSKDYQFITNELSNYNKNSKLKLININKNTIQNLKNVKFETIVICDDLNTYNEHKDYIEDILNNAKYIIINTDNNKTNIKLNNNLSHIITFGMNQKATVTASSIKEDELLICLQRTIENSNGKMIEMQEFKKKKEKSQKNEIYNYLVSFIIEQLYK